MRLRGEEGQEEEEQRGGSWGGHLYARTVHKQPTGQNVQVQTQNAVFQELLELATLPHTRTHSNKCWGED